MAGIELFGDEERKEVNDVLETGILLALKHARFVCRSGQV